MAEDDVPLELTDVDRWGGRIMARSEGGWCAALDRNTWLCRIYVRRPTICREYRVGGSDCIAERSTAMLRAAIGQNNTESAPAHE